MRGWIGRFDRLSEPGQGGPDVELSSGSWSSLALFALLPSIRAERTRQTNRTTDGAQRTRSNQRGTPVLEGLPGPARVDNYQPPSRCRVRSLTISSRSSRGQ